MDTVRVNQRQCEEFRQRSLLAGRKNRLTFDMPVPMVNIQGAYNDDAL